MENRNAITSVVMAAALIGLLIAPAWSRNPVTAALEVYLSEAGGSRAASDVRHASGRGSNEDAMRRAARRLADEYDLPPRLYEAVVEFESGFKFARGASGEYGYAQVMPKTGQMLEDAGQVRPSWRYDPVENLRAGAVFMRNLRDSLTKEEVAYARAHGYNLYAILLAQYNGGKAGVGRYVRSGERLPYKLEWYILNVIKKYNKLDK